MGKQINFCIEEDIYRCVVEKALSKGFVILYEECVGGEVGNWKYEYHWYDEMPTFPFSNQHFFYNPTIGNFCYTADHKNYDFEQIKQLNLNLGSMFAPIVEAGCSKIYEPDKVIIRNRLYIRSNYYDSQGVLIKQNEIFLKQYNSLVRLIKKLAPMRDTERGREYMTDYMFKCYQDGYGIRG